MFLRRGLHQPANNGEQVFDAVAHLIKEETLLLLSRDIESRSDDLSAAVQRRLRQTACPHPASIAIGSIYPKIKFILFIMLDRTF